MTGRIRILFKDGNTDIIPKKLYDDYDYHDGWFVIMKNGKHIASYNMDDVTSVTVGKLEKKYKVKKGIKLYFRDYSRSLIPKKKYTDVDYCDGLFIVKRKGAWVGIYSRSGLTAVCTD